MNKGYISQELTNLLIDQALDMITGIRNNMKNRIMTIRNKILIRKRSVIETINDQQKNIAKAENSGLRGFCNFITNLVASLIASLFQQKNLASNLKQKNESISIILRNL